MIKYEVHYKYDKDIKQYVAKCLQCFDFILYAEDEKQVKEEFLRILKIYDNNLSLTIKDIKWINDYTDEGKQLEEYCHQYAEANKTDKLKVERNYKRWAKQLVDKYDQEKYNLLIF